MDKETKEAVEKFISSIIGIVVVIICYFMISRWIDANFGSVTNKEETPTSAPMLDAESFISDKQDNEMLAVEKYAEKYFKIPLTVKKIERDGIEGRIRASGFLNRHDFRMIFRDSEKQKLTELRVNDEITVIGKVSSSLNYIENCILVNRTPSKK